MLSHLRISILMPVLLCLAGLLHGQGGFDYGNAWYNPSLNYVKLKVTQEGIHRVTQTQLLAAGVSLSGLVPANLHVYHRGREIPIHVDATGGFSHFEFYGQRNDGRVDSLLYKNYGTHLADPEAQPNIHVSLFSDTAAYFVTWDGTPGLRYIPFNDVDYSSYSPEPSFPYVSIKDYPTTFEPFKYNATGKEDPNNPFFKLNSNFINCEGYINELVATVSFTPAVVLPTPRHAGSGPVEMSVRLALPGNRSHQVEFSLGSSVVATEASEGIRAQTFDYDLTTSLAGNSTVRIRNLVSGDDAHVMWVSLRYQRTMNLDGATRMKVSGWQKATKSYLAFNSSASTTAATLYDVTAGYRIPARVIGGTTLQCLVPGASAARDLHLVTDAGYLTPVIEAEPALANLSDPSSGADLILITHRSLQESALAYEQYRDTCTTNIQTCRVVYVDQIYDEFGYGTITPWAIKRFCKYALDHYATRPKNFLLWGKGMPLTRGIPANLVPTFGSPATDMEYVSDFDYSVVHLVPEAGVGRVCVQDNAAGMDYLAKVDEYEHQPYEPYMKLGIQLGGGTTATEQASIRTALQVDAAPYFEQPPLGGYLQQWQRSGGVLVSNSDLTIDQAISRGAGLIHFFGHSTDNVFDIDIRDANEYTNFGKYPFMIAMGCYGGDFTVSPPSFGERFMLAPGRGSIGYFANTTAGLVISLKQYCPFIYKSLYRDHVEESVGQAIRHAAEGFLMSSGSHSHSITTLNQVKQMALQCDPSIQLRQPQLPDPAIATEDVWFLSDNPNVDQDTFRLQVVVHNNGLALEDSLRIRLEHNPPLGAVTVWDTLMPAIAFADTFLWEVPNRLGSALAGLNTFTVTLDPQDSLVEYSEANNSTQISQLVASDAPGIVLPYNFSIVPTDTCTLVASEQMLSTADDLLYLFEIDTSYFFGSPARRASPVIRGSSSRGEWKLPFTLQENVVYYWRVRFASVNPASWTVGSFIHVPGQNGWSQSRPHQMLTNPSNGVGLTPLDPVWAFDPISENLHAQVKAGRPDYYLGAYRSTARTGANGVNYTPITFRNLEPQVQDAAQGDWRFCSLPDAQAQISEVINAMNDGDYFLMASDNSPRLATWNSATLLALEKVGMAPGRLEGLPDHNPIVFLGRKGYPGSAHVVTTANLIGTDSIPVYDLDVNLNGIKDEGTIVGLAGPAVSYQSLEWQWSTLDQLPDESASLDVVGVRADGTTATLLNDLTEGLHDLSAIDAGIYPSLRLVAHVKDSYRLTPPQLDQWTVLYVPVPEAALDPATHFRVNADSLQKGQPMEVEVALRSMIPVDMDSILLRTWIEGQDDRQFMVWQGRLAPLPGLGLDTALLHLDTRMLSGSFIFHVEANPNGDQPEQHHFNNLFSFPFYIYPDDLPPNMEVTVDGRHLMEGDIVSPSPEIIVQMKDENQYLPLTVSDSTFEVRFGPGRLEENLALVPIEGNPNVEAVNASLPENRSRMVFRPGKLADGEYTLRVTARDQNGNAPQHEDYEIHFNVVNESSISRVLPYPNPFSSSCQWAYLLTGSELPYRFELEIYTISGRLVRRLDLAASEELHAGYNLTRTVWDGRDEYGDELANGVYIYKVLVKFRDRDTEITNPAGDEFFSNDFGKVYLMR